MYRFEQPANITAVETIIDFNPCIADLTATRPKYLFDVYGGEMNECGDMTVIDSDGTFLTWDDADRKLYRNGKLIGSYPVTVIEFTGNSESELELSWLAQAQNRYPDAKTIMN